MKLELRPVTRDNLSAVCQLDAGDGGQHVASNQRSMAQAAVHPEAWPRAIVADGELVGFLMLSDPSLTPAPENPHYDLWRLMIDCSQQGKGYGAAAIQALIAHVRTRPGADALHLSYVPGNTGGERLYRSLGFEPTGEIDDGEIVMRLKL